MEDAAKSYAMGKTATLFKAELGQSKAASPANVPNSYEVWQAQQGCNSIDNYFVPSDLGIVPKRVPDLHPKF